MPETRINVQYNPLKWIIRNDRFSSVTSDFPLFLTTETWRFAITDISGLYTLFWSIFSGLERRWQPLERSFSVSDGQRQERLPAILLDSRQPRAMAATLAEEAFCFHSWFPPHVTSAPPESYGHTRTLWTRLYEDWWHPVGRRRCLIGDRQDGGGKPPPQEAHDKFIPLKIRKKMRQWVDKKGGNNVPGHWFLFTCSRKEQKTTNRNETTHFTMRADDA